MVFSNTTGCANLLQPIDFYCTLFPGICHVRLAHFKIHQQAMLVYGPNNIPSESIYQVALVLDGQSANFVVATNGATCAE